MVLTGSAGIRPRRTWRGAVRVRSYKVLRALERSAAVPAALRRAAGRNADQRGSADYRAVSGVMRGTLVRLVNEDVRGLLPSLHLPVLLIWGDQDSETPIDDGRLMERLIPDAGLVVFEGAGHFAYLEQPGRFCRIVDVFLRDEPGRGRGVSPLVGPLVAAAAIVWLILIFRVVLVAARMFQIEEYESVRFLRWGLTREWLAHRAVWLGLLVGAVALSVAAILPAGRPVAIAVAWLVSAAAAQFTWRWTSPKRPLVMTARMRRLLIAGGFLAVVLAAGLALGIVALHPVVSLILVLIAAGLVTGLSEILLVAANVVTKPAESRIRRHYLALASERIRTVDPLVVAVAGSYGKTSTKQILAQLLQPHVNTLPTRKSFNTLMGVTRVINEDLTPENRIFIVEMDAYAPGEIAAISNLVHPRVAIITAIGPQHMERFGTLDRIAGALYEVASALPADGTLILYTGDEPGAALAQRARAERRRLIRYALATDGARGRRRRGRVSDPHQLARRDLSLAVGIRAPGPRGGDSVARPPPGGQRERGARRGRHPRLLDRRRDHCRRIVGTGRASPPVDGERRPADGDRRLVQRQPGRRAQRSGGARRDERSAQVPDHARVSSSSAASRRTRTGGTASTPRKCATT